MIALDTGILIYGVQAARSRMTSSISPTTLEHVPRALMILDRLSSLGKSILVPAPAAWEYVCGFASIDQVDVWSGLKGFAVAPFDAAAARLAAQIARAHFDEVLRSQHGQGKRQLQTAGTRQQIKVDMQIVAIAIAQRAEAIYTLEVDKFSVWADGRIPVYGLNQTYLEAV